MRLWASGESNMNQGNSKITVIILAKNEEVRIGGCLKSVEWADECIVVDNDSTDKTAHIAKETGAIVLTVQTPADFASLRNMGRQKASGEWLLYIDADEKVTHELRKEIVDLVDSYTSGSSPVAYFIKRKNYYLGQEWPYQDKMERLFYKKALTRWEGKLHESPQVTGLVSELESPLVHNTHRTLEEMVSKTNEWSAIEADLRHQAHHPPIVWWRFIRVMLTSFNDSFFRQGGWRTGTRGWIESIFQAFSAFVTYAKLWELQQKR